MCETAKVIAHSFEIEGENELKNVVLFKKVKLYNEFKHVF